MNPRHFSQHRAENADGLDDPLHLEPTDLRDVSQADYAKHEGEPVMLTPELLEYVSTKPCDTTAECDHIEETLEAHYHLDSSGWGITWDTRDRSARLIKL